LDTLLGSVTTAPSSSQHLKQTAVNDPIENLVFPSSMLSPQEEAATNATTDEIRDPQQKTTETAVNKDIQQIQEEKISSTSNQPELPPNFSLLAPVHLPLTVTSSELLEICKFIIDGRDTDIHFTFAGKKRLSKPEEYKPIFDENVPPPKPPVPENLNLPKEKLLLKTPVILVENQRDALSIELQQFCYNQPIVLIHGLTLALKIDLSQFSTKTLIQTAAEHEVEVRSQYKMPYDVNVDQMGNPTWFCVSIQL
jgi:hypothetical protein